MNEIIENKIIEEAKKYYKNDINCYDAFLHGVEWCEDNFMADSSISNTKSPWISVDDDLPCNHEELIDTTRHCTVSKDVIVRHKDGSVTFERMIKNYKSQWIFLSDVTHWMPIPKLPKE